MITIACLVLAAAAQTPVVDVVAPVDPEITVTRTSAGSRYDVLLTNNTERDIVGVGAVWTPEGGRSYTVVSDSFGSMNKPPVVPFGTNKPPIVARRGQAVLTPDGFGRTDFVPTGTPTVGLRERPHPEFDNAYRVTINVDAVIFDDGQVIGPDKSGLVDSINGRVVAIARISQAVQKAKNEGQDITAALRGLMPPPGTNLALAPPDAVTNWIIVYAGQLLRFPDRREARLSELEKLPKPPTFFRK
jgi:hypothetical protein